MIEPPADSEECRTTALGFLDRALVPSLLVASAFLWIVGVTQPILTVTKLFLWVDDIVIWRAVAKLFEEGEAVLALVVLLFTLVLPLAKLLATAFAFRGLRLSRAERAALGLKWVERFSKWSMLDVFVIAVAVFAAKSGWQAEAQIRPGLYCFAGFAILSSALVLRVRNLGERARVHRGR